MFFKNKKNNNDNIIRLNSFVDFTLLDPRATIGDLEKLCNIANKNEYFSVCVNPANVSFVKEYISKNFKDRIKIVSVVGFPLGANAIDTIIFETKKCLVDGADEIDFVINIGKLKEGNFSYLRDEILQARKATKGHILKIIIETCYLNQNEIIKISQLCCGCKVDFIKTSTGFGTAGASIEIIKAIKDAVKNKCKIKASGGIRTREQAIELVNNGADRIGTSHII